MSRLPKPGRDSENWGAILNDFLSVAHNANGTLKPRALTAAGAVRSSSIGADGGVASLDGSGLIPSSQLGNPITAMLSDKGGQVYNTKAYGAKGDGATDDTLAFNNAIHACSAAGGGIVHAPAGNYVLKNNITLLSKVILQGSGNASQLTMGDRKYINIEGQQLVAIRDLYMEMDAGTETRNQQAIKVYNSFDVIIENCHILNCYGFGILTVNDMAGTDASRFHYLNNRITGKCHNDLIGGGSLTANSYVTDFCIQGNFLLQDATKTGAGEYFGCFDIVAMHRAVISGNICYGNLNAGGESIPVYNVTICDNVLLPPRGAPTNLAAGRLQVLAGSVYGQSADSYSINVTGNNIAAGTLIVEGQGPTSNRTRKVIVANNTISGTKNQLYEQDNNGIHLEDLANVTLENNIIEGSNIGIKVLQVDEINVSNNKVLDSTTNFSESSVTMLSGNNNLGINPDTAYFQGNATGETIFDRKNGTTIAATLVGDITVTLPNGSFPSDVLTLRLTQDGTGSRKVNWPSNFKKSNGTLVLSTSPSAVDSITMMWSNTNWVEVGRALNVS